MGRVGQRLRRLKLTLSQQHLGALLSLGFSLFGHRALHGSRQLNIFDLDRRDFDTKELGLLVNNHLYTMIDFLTLI
jgi:hypothetical protein